mgnify:CR=1 FL=1
MTSTPHPYAKDRAPNPAAKTAHAWLHTAKFLTTAPTLDFLPPHDLPEIAFVGRSNAGKSQLTPADVGAVSTWLSSQVVANAGKPATSLPAPLPMPCGGLAD